MCLLCDDFDRTKALVGELLVKHPQDSDTLAEVLEFLDDQHQSHIDCAAEANDVWEGE